MAKATPRRATNWSDPFGDEALSEEEIAAIMEAALATEEEADQEIAAPQSMGAQHALVHSEEDSLADLCVGLLSRAISDLQHKNRNIRKQAIWDVEQGGCERWITTLPISEEAMARVRTLLADLARCARL